MNFIDIILAVFLGIIIFSVILIFVVGILMLVKILYNILKDLKGFFRGDNDIL